MTFSSLLYQLFARFAAFMNVVPFPRKTLFYPVAPVFVLTGEILWESLRFFVACCHPAQKEGGELRRKRIHWATIVRTFREYTSNTRCKLNASAASRRSE